MVIPEEFLPDVEQCLLTLKAGGVILYPTDTIWGLGCDATRPEAIDRIYRIKQRPLQKSMIILVAEQRDILQYTAGPDPAIFDFLDTQSKPTTVIYENALGLADNLPEADGSIAIRVVQDPFCRHLIKRLRSPLVSTSANISGQPPPRVFAEMDPAIIQSVDYVVGYRQSDSRTGQPSAIIRWEDGKPVFIRH